MKAAILVCVVCAVAASALAAPRYTRPTRLDARVSERVRAAEQAWTAAERETDPAKQVALWEQAAGAFADVDGDPVDAKVKREAAYAAVLAWKNTLAADVRIAAPARTLGNEPVKPRDLPAREVKLIAAIDCYAKYSTDPNDPELPALLFIKARTYSQFDQMEAAIPIYRSIVDRYPQHEVADAAAQLLLDAYSRLGRLDELIQLADELAKNKPLLHDRDDLAATVARIQHAGKRKHIEQLEAAANAAHDDEQFSAVGTAYLELYNSKPESPDWDELLYNAGVSFERGHAIGSAIHAFTMIEKSRSRTRLYPRAIQRLGRLFADIAMYDKAAEQLEKYAAMYAGEKDALDAMSDAIYYRKALGDRDKAAADTSVFIKTWGLKRPREAADAMWSMTVMYEAEPDLALAHLRGYLRSFGAKGGGERVVIAQAKIGQLLWKQSCPVPGIDSMCIKPNERAARTCGTGTTETLAVIARDPRKAKEALAAFGEAIKTYAQLPATDDSTARSFYAQAKLAVADAELEPYFALSFPRGLSFTGATRLANMKRFSNWLEQKQAAAEKVLRQYDAVLAIKDPASAITAAARRGFILQSMASALVTAEIPREVRAGPHATEQLKAYCDALTVAAEPLEETEVTAFGVCLAKSTELAWFSESSRQCERELIRMKPDEFPRASELRIQPLEASPVIAVEPPPY